MGAGLQGGATEGCFRAYTERAGPNSQWPGILLATELGHPGIDVEGIATNQGATDRGFRGLT